MPSSAANPLLVIGSAALRLAGEKGWRAVSLEAVAKRAKLPLATVKKHAASVAALVPIIADNIDREAFAALGKPKGAARDVLFDLLMARFDVLQKHRQAILSMAEAAPDRVMAFALARATMEGAYRLAGAVEVKKPPRPVLAVGLTAVYGWAYCAWRKDDSRDMAKTMAALDRALRLAEQAMKLLP